VSQLWSRAQNARAKNNNSLGRGIILPGGDKVLMKAMSTAALLSLVSLIALIGASGQSKEPSRYRIIPIKAMSQDVEVLYGDPEKVGQPFVIRIRELPGGIIPPHRHPVDENITVVKGTLYFGVGEKFDRAAMKEMKVGSYAFIPKGRTMFGYTPDAAIVQVHGVGPFHIDWRAGNTWWDNLKTLDDPDASSVFRFKKGERVIAKRGVGRIRQGYDSGEVIGYDVQRADGTLFMALEGELLSSRHKR
jgi:quercetin dioxygenase-like cupin family protein